jgi:hypothetical protein
MHGCRIGAQGGSIIDPGPMGKLFRRYCIEVNRTPSSKGPFVLRYIHNSNHEDVLNGWMAMYTGARKERSEGSFPAGAPMFTVDAKEWKQAHS